MSVPSHPLNSLTRQKQITERNIVVRLENYSLLKHQFTTRLHQHIYL